MPWNCIVATPELESWVGLGPNIFYKFDRLQVYILLVLYEPAQSLLWFPSQHLMVFAQSITIHLLFYYQEVQEFQFCLTEPCEDTRRWIFILAVSIFFTKIEWLQFFKTTVVFKYASKKRNNMMQPTGQHHCISHCSFNWVCKMPGWTQQTQQPFIRPAREAAKTDLLRLFWFYESQVV